MSFVKRDDAIKDGDIVIVRRENMLKPLIIERDKRYQLTAGYFNHNDIIGKPFGCQMFSHNKKSTMTILAPTPELWTLALPHRTQILYSTDISLVCLLLELRPGCVVVESGTGSGSLTHALARAVGDSGHVHTHEFHAQRCEIAAKEFESHGISGSVSVYHKNACVDGFAVIDKAHAVFLDLPNPWEAIPHTIAAFHPDGGRICSFSPCIEQVQKSCAVFEEEGFEEIQTFEAIETPYQLSRKRIWQPFVGKKSHKKFRSDQRNLDNQSEDLEWANAFVKGGPRKDGVGHTGYLTFATLPAKELIRKRKVPLLKVGHHEQSSSTVEQLNSEVEKQNEKLDHQNEKSDQQNEKQDQQNEKKDQQSEKPDQESEKQDQQSAKPEQNSLAAAEPDKI